MLTGGQLFDLIFHIIAKAQCVTHKEEVDLGVRRHECVQECHLLHFSLFSHLPSDILYKFIPADF